MDQENLMDSKLFSAFKKFSSEKMMKVNLFETDHLFCDIYCLEPGQNQKVHTHQEADKIYFVLEGEGYFHIGDEKEALGEGNCILASAGLEHGVENRSNQQLVLLVMMAPNPNKKAKD
jgi:mannose-6-phosphate isomerase-like protein (cupin superfamily)